MSKNKKKNAVNIILLLGTLAVWSFIISHIIKYFTNGSDSSDEVISNVVESKYPAVSKSESLSLSSHEWIKLDRNPFLPRNTVLHKNVSISQNEVKNNAKLEKPKSVPIPKQTIPIPRNNDMIVTGIIVNSKSKLAIMVDLNDNKTIFMHEGEEYKGMFVKKILDNSVTVYENNSERDISLKK